MGGCKSHVPSLPACLLPLRPLFLAFNTMRSGVAVAGESITATALARRGRPSLGTYWASSLVSGLAPNIANLVCSLGPLLS